MTATCSSMQVFRQETDLWLNTDSEKVYKMGDVSDNATLVTALRNASHDILYTVVNSSAMNGIDENVVVKKVLPLWQYWLIAFDIAMAVIIIGGVILIVRRCRKTIRLRLWLKKRNKTD